MTTRKIAELTPEQQALMPVLRDRWISIGLCTAPADRHRAEAALTLAYRNAGLLPPKFVWCGSPLSMALTRAVVMSQKGASVGASVGDSVRASVRDSVGDSVRASVGDSVRASVGDSVRASVRASVGDSVRASVGASVWASVGASVGASVRASVRASVGDSVRASVGDSVRASVGDSVRASVGASGYGQHDANWIGFYDFFREIGLSKQTAALEPLTELAKAAGWFLPHKGVCWISERHCIVLQDEQRRLHCLTGPAVAYPDGWKLYAVHGVRVPSDIVENPASITVKMIDAERNSEIRRIMVERYAGGPGQFLIDAKAKVIDRCDPDHYVRGLRGGRLLRRELGDDEPLVMIECINSTPEPDGHFKKYWLRVPPAMTDATEAMAWTFGKSKADYRPIFES